MNLSSENSASVHERVLIHVERLVKLELAPMLKRRCIGVESQRENVRATNVRA